MPVARSDIRQTSFERKMRAYLAAHAAGLHEQHFGWKTFRVLTVTTDRSRLRAMTMSLRALRVRQSLGPALFFFATHSDVVTNNPLSHIWQDGNGRDVRLI